MTKRCFQSCDICYLLPRCILAHAHCRQFSRRKNSAIRKLMQLHLSLSNRAIYTPLKANMATLLSIPGLYEDLRCLVIIISWIAAFIVGISLIPAVIFSCLNCRCCDVLRKSQDFRHMQANVIPVRPKLHKHFPSISLSPS